MGLRIVVNGCQRLAGGNSICNFFVQHNSHRWIDGIFLALAPAANLVFMGTSVVEGTGTAAPFATGAGTQFGQIYQMTAQVSEVASPLQRNVNRMARQASAVALALAALVFGLRCGGWPLVMP